MAAVKIASLFAEIGFKVDTAKVQQLTRLLGTMRIGLNRVATAANAANYAASGASRAQIDAHRVATAAANQHAAQYRALAAQHAASAAAARAASARARGSVSQSGGRARISTSGVSTGVQMPMGLGGVVGAGSVYGLAKSFLDTNLQIDKFNAGLLVSTGTAKAAGAQYKWLEELSDKLGTNFRDSHQQFMMFSSTSAALGFDGTQIRNMYAEIAKGQSALGMSADDAEGMTRALTQMLSKGKVMSEELKGQLAERVPGAVAIMAKAVIKGAGTVEEKIPKLFAMMEKGELESKSAVWAFLQEMNNSDGMKLAAEAQAKSMRGALNRMLNSWTKLMVAVGDSGLKDATVLVMNSITTLIDYITTKGIPALNAGVAIVKQYITPMKEWGAVALVVAASLALVGTAMFVVGSGGFYGIIGAIITRMWAFAASTWAAVAPLLPFAAVFLIAALAVSALLLVIQDLWSYFNGGSSFIGQAAEDGEYWARVLMVIADAIIWIKDALGGVWRFPEPPEWFLKMIDFVSRGIDVGASAYNSAVDTLSNGMSNTADFVGGIMPNIGGYSRTLPQVGGRGSAGGNVGVQGNVAIYQQIPAGATPEQYGKATSDAMYASAMGNAGQTQ